MSGLVKPKKYDWKDSNMALFGSDTDRQVKKESAATEPAWEGAGQEEGIEIWRIAQFEVLKWPKNQYGEFYNGDSYIILNTYKEGDSEDLKYDVHFWIGRYSTQDEYGTAAYKTVELDTLLGDEAIQHREVEGHETELFRSYFKSIVLLNGGAKTGFRHIEPETYELRLLRFNGTRRNIEVKEVQLSSRSLNSADVFVLDKGDKLIQWNGSSCSKDERFKAMMWINEIKNERGGCDSEVLEEGDGSAEFSGALPDEELEEEDPEAEDHVVLCRLHHERLSDGSGEMNFDQVKEGELLHDDLKSDDVFIIDAGKALFVWVGGKSSPQEKRNSIPYAHNYLRNTGTPWLPVSVVKEGQSNKAFEAIFG